MQNNVTEKSMKTKLSKQSLEQEIFFLKFVIPLAEIFRQFYTNKSQNGQLPNELTFSSHFLLDLHVGILFHHFELLFLST